MSQLRRCLHVEVIPDMHAASCEYEFRDCQTKFFVVVEVFLIGGDKARIE
jgi:hypothetical protein